MRLVLIDDNGKELPAFELRTRITDLVVVMPPADSFIPHAMGERLSKIFADAGVRGVVLPVHVQFARIELDDTDSAAG